MKVSSRTITREVRKWGSHFFPKDCLCRQKRFTNTINMASKKARTPSSNKASGKVYLQVLGTATEDTTASLFLFADSQRYLFNCGEGTQRLVNEHKLKLSKMSRVFFTQVKWEYVGGLPGMAMTLRDSGNSNLALCGPPNIQQLINATRFFFYQGKQQFIECVGFTGDNQEEKYSDENVTIWPVVLQGSSSKTAQSPIICPLDDQEIIDQTISADMEDENPPKKRRSDPAASSVVCYVCQLVSLPGKFLPKKAVQLGVPRGPLFGALQRGETVTLPDDTQVRPDEVIEPSYPGPVILIIDCPSMEFVPKLVKNEKFIEYQADKSAMPLLLVVHLCPIKVFQCPEYQAWRDSFGDNVKHLVINKSVCSRPFVFRSQTEIQSRLHAIEPTLFPLLHDTKEAVVGQESLPRNCIAADNFLIFHLRPGKMQGFDKSDIPDRLVVGDVIEEARQLVERTGHEGSKSNIESSNQDGVDQNVNVSRLPGTHYGCQDPNNRASTPTVKETKSFEQDSLSTHRTNSTQYCSSVFSPGSELVIEETKDRGQIQQDGSERTSVTMEFNSSLGSGANSVLDSESKHICTVRDSSKFKDFEVVFIGTGAALPSKYRNVSATLLNISDKTSVLLDCGEGTYGQLYRHYGEAVDDVIRHLSCVFISHIHADHHLGLIRVLLQRQKLKQEHQAKPTLVIGPKMVEAWLHEYDCLCESIQYRFIDSSTLVEPNNIFQDTFQQLELQQVLAVPVHHCPQAYGLVVQHTSGWKLVYSGDTRPCEELVTAGANATLLIHEATFEDELYSEALERMHSTTTEAINSGLGMNAGLIMLNHFSQRYPKIPVFSERFTKHTGIAFDHMRVRLSDFHKIPQLLELLRVFFAEEVTPSKPKENEGKNPALISTCSSKSE